MSQKIIIFDFDGVIADGLPALGKIYNEIAGRYNLKQVNFEALRDLTSREIVKRIDLPFYKLPFFIREVKKRFRSEINSIKTFAGMKETLFELKNRGCQLGIITSNSKENVKEFLKNNEIDFFDFLYSDTNLFGKKRKIKNLLRKLKVDSKNIIFVGDETRDIEAAKKSGVISAAVTWGANSKNTLEKQNPDFTIEKPEELIKILV